MTKKIVLLLLLFIISYVKSQEIKTIELKPVGNRKQLNIIPLGSAVELSFDDLDADNKEYQYKITQMTYDWRPSNLVSSQYIIGFNQNYITNVSNSFNTLQNYTHYSVTLPNQDTQITKTGNYLISVLDDDDNVVFTRRCSFYKKKVSVGTSISPTRVSKSLNKEQNVKVIVNHKEFRINNPQQEIKVVIMQNSDWKTAQLNTIPQSYQPQNLTYAYLNKNNFVGGNEFRNFDNKNIRNTSSKIKRAVMEELHHNYLYTDEPRKNLNYSYNPDANGQFVIRNIDSNEPDTEADYALTYFSLRHGELPKKYIYIVGQFNNYNISKTNKMFFSDGLYKATLKLKQGFYNYKYLVMDPNETSTNHISESLIDGSFYETDNEYTVLVYYCPIGSLYDQLIGFGNGFIKN